MERALSYSRTNTLSFEELLRQAGVLMRGARRGTCPECHAKYGVSVDFQKEKFKCWHVESDGKACGFRGGTEVLKRRLGLYEHLSPQDYAAKMRVIEQERQEIAVRRSNNRQAAIMLAGRLRQFNRIEETAHERGAQLVRAGSQPRRAQWEALDIVYRKKDRLIEELDRLDGKGGSHGR